MRGSDGFSVLLVAVACGQFLYLSTVWGIKQDKPSMIPVRITETMMPSSGQSGHFSTVKAAVGTISAEEEKYIIEGSQKDNKLY